VLAAPLAIAGCALFRRRRKTSLGSQTVRYVLGAPYQAGGLWRYPRESFSYDETGLAQVFGPHGSDCTDGAPYDPTALIAAHPTMQLPCVAQVTNLQTGLQIAVRIDDRGPESPARLLALTPRAMLLLGPGPAPGVLLARVQVLEAPSRTLADSAGAKPLLDITAAPTGAVQAESLAPPPGIAAEGGGATVAASAPPAASASKSAVPLRLPEAVTQVPVQSAELFVDLGAFGHAQYARRLAARLPGLGAVVSTDYETGGDRPFRVRVGPLATVADADATLDQALGAGVVDARIVVDQ
jgi:rare lipoprotein A